MSRFTLDQLRAIFPDSKKETLAAFVEPLNSACEHFDISTKARAAAFIAQVGHESAGFSAIRENLNYSQDGLRRVFSKYFPNDALAAAYARKPEKIANRVYASRMGNGDEKSGDGYEFRGRGAIQITGKNNYTAFAVAMKMALPAAVNYMETPEGAVMSAAWFWGSNGLNTMADQTRFTDITRRINGGVNGLADRKEIWARALKVLK